MSLKLVREWAQADQEPRRQPGDRLRVGADRARPGARPDRGAHADQLEARRRRRRRGDLSPAEASATKIYGSELATEVYRSLMEVVGPNARRHRRLRRRGARGPARALLPLALVMTFGGGTNEIQRDIIGYVGPRPAGSEAVGARPWTSPSPPSRTRPPSWPPRSSRTGRTNERMKAVEAEGDRFDRELWAELGSAGLLGLALPEEYDGAGLGLVELCRVLVEVGRTVAPVPLAAHGPASPAARRARRRRAQRTQWLPGAASGERRADRRGRRGPRLRAGAADHRRGRRRRRLPADRHQDDRAGRHRRRRVPRAGRDARRRGASSWSSRATRASRSPRRRSPTATRVARLDLDGVAVSATAPVGPADGSADRAAAPPAARWPARAEQLGITEGALRAHRVVREDPRAVRPPDRDLPGRVAAAGRRLHRRARASG